MPTQPYYNKANQRLRSNTTIIDANCGWGKPGLMGWQTKMFKAQMCKDCLGKLKTPKEFAAEAAAVGTICHAAIENHIKHGTMPGEIDPRALTGFNNYLEWLKMVNFQPLTMEVPVISEQYQFGTTIDILGMISGKRSITEIKTSNDLWPEMLIQLSAQRVAWEENHPEQPIERVAILKVGKESASFTYYHLDASELNPAFQAFLCLKELDKAKGKLEAML